MAVIGVAAVVVIGILVVVAVVLAITAMPDLARSRRLRKM